MTYRLKFLADADKEWRKLDSNTRGQFKKKLTERLERPRAPSAQLRGSKDRYKIKLRSSGYRLVYEVRDAEIVVLVIARVRVSREKAVPVAAKVPNATTKEAMKELEDGGGKRFATVDDLFDE